MQLQIKFIVLNIGSLICCLGLSLIAPFYPTYAERFDISKTLLGLIFAINPIGGFIASLIVGKLLNQNNQTNILCLGMIIQAIGLFQYPLLTLTDNKDIFIAISLLGRFISGCGAQTFMTPLYASIPQLFPESVDQKIAIAEFFQAFGYLSGPVIGSALYALGGFSFPFLVFASSSVIIAIVMKFNFNNIEQQKIEPLEASANADLNINLNESILSKYEESSIGYQNLLKMYMVSTSLSITLALSIVFTYYSPTYAIYFQNQFQVPPENVGYYMALTSLSYSIGALIVPYLKIDRTVSIVFGMTIVSISQFFMGPDPFTHLEPKIYITLSAQFMYGLFSAPPYIYVLPFITTILQEKFEKMHHDKCLSLTSGLFNAVISLGEFIGPIFSGIMGDFFTFQRSASFLGLYLLLTTAIFIPNIWKSNKLQKPAKYSFDEQL